MEQRPVLWHDRVVQVLSVAMEVAQLHMLCLDSVEAEAQDHDWEAVVVRMICVLQQTAEEP